MDKNPEVEETVYVTPKILAERYQSQSSACSSFNSNRGSISVLDDNLLCRNQIPKYGYCLILNHYKYKNVNTPIREGTQVDVEALEKVFSYYNIETVVRTDLHLSEIKEEINLLIQKDFSYYKCVIIVLLTHGGQINYVDVALAHDKVYKFTHVIEDPLIYGNKSLIDKPKIFLIQACRGALLGTEIILKHEPAVQSMVLAKRNIIKFNATVGGFNAYLNTECGSPFIQLFCQKLKQMGEKSTILDVMVEVNKELSDDQDIPQLSSIKLTSINNFYFGSLLKQKKGFCLILNHYKYKNDFAKTLEGTPHAVEKLVKVFGYYNIETMVRTDLNLSEIKEVTNLLIEKDFSNYQCFILVLLTHGYQNKIVLAHDMVYNFIDVIENPLTNGNKSLFDKPKIFLLNIQALNKTESQIRTNHELDSEQCPHSLSPPVIQTTMAKLKVLVTQELPETDSETKIKYELDSGESIRRSPWRMREEVLGKRNIFKCYKMNFAALRNTECGPPFIPTFCKILKEFGDKLTIYEIIMKVNNDISNDDDYQVCSTESTMVNPFCFGSLLN